MPLTTNSPAPTFALPDTDRKERTLKEFAGKKLILAFYPGAFTPVCQKELCSFRDSLGTFNQFGAQVLGISVDSPFANKAFAAQNDISFPLLSDHTREVSKAYGGVHEDFAGMKGYSASKRAVFVLDNNHVVKYAWISDNPGNEPPYEEVKKALA
ncbi:MAG: peroxiredoxin [Deltaproteobacteria bacterium]|nr:peroxiredoxin [Deltaproteobacteria bacterium]